MCRVVNDEQITVAGFLGKINVSGVGSVIGRRSGTESGGGPPHSKTWRTF